MNGIDEILTRGVANIIPGKSELEKLLNSGKKLNIYLGIDPTATKIHLGHAVPLRKLQAFAELGHNVTFLIGDFTALIGDTSDKDSERPTLTSHEIENNFQTYKKQAEKVLDFSKVTVKHNSEWLSTLGFKDILKLTHEFSLNDFMSRELIAKRFKEGKRIALQEVLYPAMQAYDSFMLDTDIQIGGTDQTFNIQAGRTILNRWKNKESFVITTPILTGSDGQKMSKTSGNAIWLEDAPNNMYGKIMSIPDNLITEYFTLATKIGNDEIKRIEQEVKENPMNAKKKLAHQIVEELHDKDSADSAQDNFERTVQNKELPNDVTTTEFSKSQMESMTVADILVEIGFADSKSDAKRLVDQNAVKINNEVTDNPQQSIFELVENDDKTLIQVGRKNLYIAVK